MIGGQECVASEPAPRRQILRRPWVQGDEAQHMTGGHRLHAPAELEDEVTAGEVARVPYGVDPRWGCRRLSVPLGHAGLPTGVSRA